MTLTLEPSAVKIDGIEYEAHPATITRTNLEWEDHGIFSCMVFLDLHTGGSQGFGGYCLDGPRYDPDDRERTKKPNPSGTMDRRGTTFGAEFIMSVVHVCGADVWKGNRRDILALKKKPVAGGSTWRVPIDGIASLDGKRYFLAPVLADMHREVSD